MNDVSVSNCMMYDGNPTIGTTALICAQPLALYNMPNFAEKKKPPLKVKFSPEEDAKLLNLVQQYGAKNWIKISQLMETRNPRQCRERYNNYINPNLRKDEWKKEEDDLIEEKVLEFGPKWNKISKFFDNRSDYSIRNRWMMLERHKAKSKKIDNKFKVKSFFKNSKNNCQLNFNPLLDFQSFQNKTSDVCNKEISNNTFVSPQIQTNFNSNVVNTPPPAQNSPKNYHVIPLLIPDVKVAQTPKTGMIEPLFDLNFSVDDFDGLWSLEY